ncbi:hypothetical protein [Mycobacteroides abscessus]
MSRLTPLNVPVSGHHSLIERRAAIREENVRHEAVAAASSWVFTVNALRHSVIRSMLACNWVCETCAAVIADSPFTMNYEVAAQNNRINGSATVYKKTYPQHTITIVLNN